MSSAVIRGEIQYLSVSSLSLGDARDGGCLKKWWKRYIEHFEDTQSKSMAAGTALHSELETYLKTGETGHLSALAIKGICNLPTPRNPKTGELDLLVEQSIGSQDAPFVTADGIPLRGFIDYLHDRETNAGTDDITQSIDPSGTVEVGDHKWKSDGSKTEYMLQPDELVRSIQMSGYGVFVGKAWPNKSYVRLSHNYYPATRGTPRKVTKLHVLEDCTHNWEYVEGTARVLRGVAKETDWDKVPGNRHSCAKYGGCPHRSTCTTYQQNSLTTLFGDDSMGLILPPNLQPTPKPEMRIALEQQEQQQRAQAAVTAVGVIPGFQDACNTISMSGKGFPSLGGAAAQMYAALGGQSLAPGTVFEGQLALKGIRFDDPNHVLELANEIRGAAAPVVTHVQHMTAPISTMVPMGILPPDAPQSRPELAAKPIEGYTPPEPQVTEETRRKRRTKAEMEAARVSSPAPVTQAAIAVTPSAEVVATGVGDTLSVFVDCIPNGTFESLHPYIDQICAALNAKFNTTEGALQDIRCVSDKNSPLAFGGWRGALRAIVIEVPPSSARYYLDTRGNEVAAEVADGLRAICEKKSALYVRGVR